MLLTGGALSSEGTHPSLQRSFAFEQILHCWQTPPVGIAPTHSVCCPVIAGTLRVGLGSLFTHAFTKGALASVGMRMHPRQT